MPKKPRHLPVEQAQAGASPVDPAMFCPGGVIGSRASFKNSWDNTREGSTPSLGTNFLPGWRN